MPRTIPVATFFAWVLWTALAPAAAAQSRRVAVVVMEGRGFRTRARVAIALRKELASKGRLATNPALVFDTSGPSQAEIATARKKFKAAVGLYDGLSFSKARAELAQAVSLFRAVVAKGAAPGEYIKALHYLGAAALYDNDRAKAQQHFAEAAVFSPKTEPDESIFSPDVIKAYTEAKAAGAATCSMQIRSKPAAEVSINGQPRGVSKLALEGLKPGRYLIRFVRAGYEVDAQWIAVEEGASAEVRTELKPLPQLAIFRQTLKAVAGELGGARPGAAVARLMKTLSVDSLIVVSSAGKAVVASWAEGGYWVKRNRATVAVGGEAEFAGQLLASGGIAPPPGGCGTDADCTGDQTCANGRCVASTGPTPIYKKWWFWTIIGAAVAGGTVGVIFATRDTSEDWRYVLKPGGVQ
jgi:hypothetical protein